MALMLIAPPVVAASFLSSRIFLLAQQHPFLS
jgi:hypothetical protein